jgi:hypothetical protein
MPKMIDLDTLPFALKYGIESLVGEWARKEAELQQAKNALVVASQPFGKLKQYIDLGRIDLKKEVAPEAYAEEYHALLEKCDQNAVLLAENEARVAAYRLDFWMQEHKPQ